MKPTDHSARTPGPAGAPRCEEVQGLLFEYLARELGPARSDFVREHLRRCESCQAAAAEIQAALDALRRADAPQPASPPRLSDERRRHIRWALAHPVRDWVDRHHTLVSIVVAVVVVLILFSIMRNRETWENDPVEGVPVILGREAGTGEEGGAP